MERQMTAVDVQAYLRDVKDRIVDAKVIALVEEDLEYGLMPGEINDYTDRGLSFEQMKAVSNMYRNKIPMSVVASIGARKIDAEKMKVATELYLKQIPVEDIEKALADTNTARDMRKAFELALGKVQTAIALSEEAIVKEPLEKEQAKELTEMIRSLAETVQSHTGNYETIEKMLKQMETIRLDEAVAKNLTSLNEKLEKENRELTEQLESKQNEVNKGLQAIAQLRTETENLKKEMKIMQDKNTDLEQQIFQKDETIHEQEQAIIAKNSTIEKYKSAEEKEAGEHYHEKNVSEESLEKQPENENKQKYNSQTVAQQTVSIPPGEIPIYANANGIPVYYTMTLVQDKQMLQRADIDYMYRKTSVFEGIMSKFAFKKKPHKDLVQLVINKELSSEQVNAIRGGLESGLDEEQLELIINKKLTPEKIQSIIRFAALQNSLKVERGGM